MDLLSELNPQQREAVINTEGPLLILAGAGSGKTRVITYRIAYLVADRGIPPHNILAVTFTNKAAQEMRKRVAHLLSGMNARGSGPLISTFHGLCVRILRQDIEALGQGFTHSFTIYDQDDSVRLIKSCIRDLGYDEKQLGQRAVQGAISGAKNRGDDVDSYAARVEYDDEKRAATARIFKLYQERMHRNNALDFDDLIIRTVQLLRRSTDVREKYNERFRYILVDEYQDTNSLQFALVSLLTQKQQNICVVGDEDQSVYRWRGADIKNILDFETHFSNTKIIRLEQNYRSTQTILDVAGAVVQRNTERKGKRLWTANPSGERIRYFQAFDAEAEARFVAGKIEEHRRAERTLRAAVLYRTNAQSRVFEESLRRTGIPYNIVGGFSFYERAEVKDVIAYLKVALNPDDSIALQRIINSAPRGLGKQTLDEIYRRARDYDVSLWQTISLILEQDKVFAPRALSALRSFQKIILDLTRTTKESTMSDSPVSDVVKGAILDTGYSNALKSEGTDEAEVRLDNLQELVNAAVDFDREGANGLRDFIDHAALISDQDQYKREAPVTLMTMHSAKGLEFPLVFIVGLEDGLFPHSRAASDPAELEEERRLCYVGITRAERFLYVTHAMRRRVYGEDMVSEPSQFLNEMPLDLMEDLSRGPSWLSFARGSNALEDKHGMTVPAQRAERTKYSGKTYDSVDSIAEFFRKRSDTMGPTQPARNQPVKPKPRPPLRSVSSINPADFKNLNAPAPAGDSPTNGDFTPGSHVRHSKYGRGLVLRREGTGDSVKLLVSFPGFGQKKLVEKYAGLVKA